MNPKFEAAAFRIWQHCEEHGWDFYPTQLAEILDIPIGVVQYAIRRKKWQERLLKMCTNNPAHQDEAAIYRIPDVDKGPQELEL